MSKPIDIRKVPVDVSDKTVKSVYNPLTVDFVHKFDGVEQTIPSGESAPFPENIAVHLARHLAKRIVMQVGEEEREEILKDLSKEEKQTVQMKPIPRFKYRVGDVAKLLVSDIQNKVIPSDEEILKVASETEAKEGEKKEAIVTIPEVKLRGKKSKEEKTKTETETKQKQK